MADLKALHDDLVAKETAEQAAKAATQAARDAFAAAGESDIPDGGEFTTNPTPVTIVTRVGTDVHRRVVQPLPTGVPA